MATAQIENGKLSVKLNGTSGLASLMLCLPESRFNHRKNEWTAAATPMAADILSGCEEFASAVTCSDDIHNLAETYADAMTPPTAGEILGLRFGTEPWSHQKRAIAFGLRKYAAMLAMEMGTGKSLVAVTLVANWQCKTVVVLCPKSVIGVWRREFEHHYPDPFAVICLERGTTAAKQKAAMYFFAGASPGVRVLVVNYETAWREPLAKWLLSQQWDAVILDESHRIKAHDGRASKFCYQLGKRTQRRLCLTGTPMPHSPLDLYAQFRFLEPALFGTSYTRFRSRYAKCNEMFKSQVEEWINQDELKEKYSPLTIRFESADVLDLPSCLHERVPVELSKKSQDAYEAMEDEMVAAIDDGEITASNALVKLLRLQQITSGGVKTPDGELLRIGTDKRDALIDILSDLPISEPVLVFCRFQADLDAIQEAAEKLGRNYGEISGRRKDLTEHATMPEGIQLMGVQEQAGGVGIDLTRSRYAFWFSPSFSLGDFDQANARFHRPGQSRPVTVYHLVARGTIDEAIYGALEKRRKVVDEVLEVLRSESKEVPV